MRKLLAKILEFSIPINIVFFGLIMYAILVAIPQLPVEVFPNMSFRQVQVTLRYPGASAEEVERLVTRPIEDSIRGLEKTEYVASTSVPGRSEVIVKIDDDGDMKEGYDQFRFRVLAALNGLPQVNGKVLQPLFMELDVDAWVPVIQVMLVNEKNGDLDKRALTILAKELRDQLERIPGVKRVDFAGEEFDQFEVPLDPHKLDRYGITFSEVLEALTNHGGSQPAGQVDTPLGERTIRVDTRPRNPADVLDVVVRTDGQSSFITVADLVDPQSTGVQPIPEAVGNSLDGREAIGCRVLKDGLSNAKMVRNDVLQAMEDFKASHTKEPFEMHAILDSTRKINDSMSVLHDSLFLAMGLVIASLYFFLSKKGISSSAVALLLTVISTVVVASSQDLSMELVALGSLALFVFFTCRSAVLTVSGIMFALLGTLIVFYATDRSINEVSLIGFVLTVGIIVDDAIIVLENIRRHREMGKKSRDAIIEGTREVIIPVTTATLTTVAAFLPMLLMTGTVGDFFSILPISVATALAVSLVECLIILPSHVNDLDRLLGQEPVDIVEESEGVNKYLLRQGFSGKLSRAYDKIFLWNLKHGLIVLIIAALLFVGAIGVLTQSVIGPGLGMRPMLKLVFFPEDSSILNIAVNTPPGTGLKETDRIVRELSMELRATGYVEAAVGLSGMKLDSTYRPQFSHQVGLILAEFPLRDERVFADSNDAIAALRDQMVDRWLAKGVKLEITAQKDGPPLGAPVTVRIQGSDLDAVDEIARRTYRLLGEESRPGGRLEGVVDLTSDLDQETIAINFIPDQRALSIHGLDPAQLRLFVAGAFDGIYAGDYLRADDEIPIRVRFMKDAVADPTLLLNLPLTRGRDGGVLRFGEVGSVSGASEPGILRRRHYQRSVNINGNLTPDAIVNSDTVASIIDQELGAEVRSRAGVSFSYEGEAQGTQRSFESLLVALWIAIFIIYLIMATQFRSFIHPLVVLSNVGFAFTGVVIVMSLLALFSDLLPAGMIRAERSYITILGAIAMVGLTGIVVNDAIVLVDFIQRRRSEGRALDDALRLAGHERMRPIIMTTVSTIAGLLPMAIGIPHFDVRWSPFATVFVSGLMVATMMTLLVVPVLYRYSALIEKKLTPKNRSTDSHS